MADGATSRGYSPNTVLYHGRRRAEFAFPLRSQSVTSRTGRGQHGKYQAKAMSQVVANRDRLARAFVRLRRMLASSAELASKLAGTLSKV